MLYFSLFRGFPGGVGVVPFFIAPGAMGTQAWWALAVMTTFWMVSITNLVFLAENRLALPTENKVTSLRVGFLVQFLLIAGWMLTFIDDPANIRSNAIKAFGVLGGLHLAIVAMFTVTEDLVAAAENASSDRKLPPMALASRTLSPGGGRGAAYVLAQMAILLGTAGLLGAYPSDVQWLLAICWYICFFSGVPMLALRALKRHRRTNVVRPSRVLVLMPASMLLPDLVYYVLWRPEVLDLTYSARHLLNPIRTLSNWDVVETRTGPRAGPDGFRRTALLLRIDRDRPAHDRAAGAGRAEESGS